MEKKAILERIKEIRKDQWILLLLAGILALVISLPAEPAQEEKGREQEGISGQEEMTEKGAETRLAEILSQMEGAGRVEVMITWEDNGERIVEKDLPVTRRTSREEGAEGTARSEEEQQADEITVYVKDGNGRETPYVTKEIAPEIAGVLVLAQGADSPVVEKNITDAVKALFGLDAHKIKVMKMQERRG